MTPEPAETPATLSSTLPTAVAFRLSADAVVPADGTATVIIGGAIDVDTQGRIVAVGREPELGPAPNDVRRVGGLLMPGLVNCHAHTPMTLMRSAGEGLALGRWLMDAVWPREGRMTAEDAWWGMALGSVEMLRAGVTTTAEMYLFEEAVLDASRTVGGRLHVMPGIVAALMADRSALGARIEAVGRFFDAHHEPTGLVRVGFGPHSAYDLDPADLALVAEVAGRRGALVHIHLEETEAERNLVLERHGATATQVLADAGVLEAKVLAAHAVWLDEVDRRLLAEASAAVAHCPQSNLKLGSGIADVPAMLAAGITVGIGTDGPASNDNLDLWEELRLAPMLARGRTADVTAMSAACALGLATRDGARALDMPDVGELRPGAFADVIRIDLDQPAFSPGLPEELFAHLVWAGSAEHVTDVWVAGEPVVVDGECVRIDRLEAQHQVAERGRRLLRGSPA